jgi:small-conductance mechanosensitive channel
LLQNSVNYVFTYMTCDKISENKLMKSITFCAVTSYNMAKFIDYSEELIAWVFCLLVTTSLFASIIGKRKSTFFRNISKYLQTTRRHISRESVLHSYVCENLKFQIYCDVLRQWKHTSNFWSVYLQLNLTISYSTVSHSHSSQRYTPRCHWALLVSASNRKLCELWLQLITNCFFGD